MNRRQVEILEAVSKDGEVLVAVLAAKHGIAEMIIRRDLDELARQGKVVLLGGTMRKRFLPHHSKTSGDCGTLRDLPWRCCEDEGLSETLDLPRGLSIMPPQRRMETQPILLADLTCDAAEAALAPFGASARAARQIRMAALRQGRIPDVLPGVAKGLLDSVRGHVRLPHLALVEKRVSPADGFAKYRFRGDGPDCFETVRIPLLHRAGDEKYVVCVSSQVGCALGCVFCATGRIGLRRNLSAWEMVDQVVQVGADSEHPVGGVVFMGMGEPLLNYEAVMRAARVMSEPCGLAISGKAITISTAGIVPGIRRMTAERVPFRLVVSLTSADPARRREMMPVESAHPTAELVESLRGYHAATRRRVTLAWIMISGVNTREQDAEELARLVKGLPVKVDLIDVNDPTGRFRPPSDEERNAFRDALRRHLGAPVARRYSGGADIHAACGMLAGGP